MDNHYLQAPSWSHWFGTNLAGEDLFSLSITAAALELITLAIVAISLHILALLTASIFGASTNPWWRQAWPQTAHFWSSMPHLLLATLLVVLIGPGQPQLIAALLIAMLAAHVIFIFSLVWDAERQHFVLAKLAVGLPRGMIFRRDILVWLHRKLTPFTVARLPEIAMLHMALSFLGFGIRPPSASLGRLLFDGLPFMFSAWWLWVFPTLIAAIILIITTRTAVMAST
ncbi:MAG: hypothetical protein AB2708_16725 [Candidatus Thiodiazotropha taylori]